MSTAVSTFTTVTTERSGKRSSLVTKVCTSRLLFVTCLCIVAALLGYGANRLLKDSEEDLAEEHFEAIADHALNQALDITLRKRLAVKSIATVLSNKFPDAHTWPNVSMMGFEEISESIIDVAQAKSIGFCPFVTVDQLAGFEEFAYNVAFKEINDYPNTTGLRDFDGDGVSTAGIHSYDSNLKLYQQTNDTVFWDNKYPIICPFIMHSAGPKILMLNVYSLEMFGVFIDEMLSCVDNRGYSEIRDFALNDCAILSDFHILYDQNGLPSSPSAFIIQPVHPDKDKNLVTGVITSTMEWSDVLGSLFSKDVSGVDCVLETETQAYSYQVQHGIPAIRGEGDLHDPAFSSYGRSIDVYSPGLFSYTSASYALTLYPNEALFDTYGTRNPTIAAGGTLGIIIFTSFLFFIFDFFVRQEFHKKKAIMETKRRFVRFISHEVRTPLNTICMGSQLLKAELSKFSQLQKSGDDNSSIQSSASSTKNPVAQEDCLTDWLNINRDILTNADSAVNVLSDLRNYDKVETGTLHLDLTIVPIWSLIQRTAAEFRLASKAKNIRYIVDFSSLKSHTEAVEAGEVTDMEKGVTDTEHRGCTVKTMPQVVKERRVVGDSVWITQVLRNLISNAVKFTPDGGSITIRVSWLPPTAEDDSVENKAHFVLERGDEVSYLHSGGVQVDVTDSGAGMSEQELKRVFREGVQFNASKLQSGHGSGLGLYIARGIVEQHGGYLKVGSRGHGYGTTFSMVLPLHYIPESEIPEKLKPQRWLFSGFEDEDKDEKDTASVFRILVVDDTRMNRKLLMRLLTGKGHVCDEAENGLIAVEMVEKSMKENNEYDTVLLNYEMPVMKGPEAAKKMRGIGCNSFIVGVTGNLIEEDVNYFKSNGANCVLGKPLNLSLLREKWNLECVG